MKIKIFCSKYFVKKTETKAIAWEKLFPHYFSNKNYVKTPKDNKITSIPIQMDRRFEQTLNH